LRLYAWALFFPFMAAAALYALAKLLEYLDQIYSIGEVVSGHTLKYLT